MRHVTVAAVQLSSGSDVESNVTRAIDLIALAARQGATYVQVPEYFNYLGPPKSFERAAEPIPGPTTDRMADVAREVGVTLHLGSLLERSPIAGKFFNTSVLLSSTGDIIATYRKIHLFDVDLPGEIVHRESDATAAGDELVVANLTLFALGMTICFDVRFPELYRALASEGAELFAVPAAFNAVTGAAHWDTLIRARAIENHAFVVAAAQVGTTNEGIATYGHSMIVDPWGVVVGQSLTNQPEVVMATIDLDEVLRRRHQIAVMQYRRPDLYGSGVRITD
ncbi:MAG TPA: carbon-nitrogen hydrolase family protein [Acidimicrobiales bacterium]